MALTKPQGLMLSTDKLHPSLLQNDESNFGLLCNLPVRPLDGHTLRLARASAPSFGALANFMTGSNPDPVGPEGTATPDNQPEFDLAGVTQDVGFNEFTIFNQSEIIDNPEDQFEKACVRIAGRLEDACFNGNSMLNPGQFNGLDTLLPSSQMLLPNDTVNHHMTVLDLARLAATPKVTSGEQIFLASRRGFKEIMNAHIQAGIDPCQALDGGSSYPLADSSGCDCGPNPSLCFNGRKVVISDKIRDNHLINSFGNGTRVYFVTLGKQGIQGITAEKAGGLRFGLRNVLDESVSQMKYRVYTSFSFVLNREDSAAALTFRPQPSTA